MLSTLVPCATSYHFCERIRFCFAPGVSRMLRVFFRFLASGLGRMLTFFGFFASGVGRMLTFFGFLASGLGRMLSL